VVAGPEALFPIGEASRRCGVSTDVIRAWERRYGLLTPARSAGNARLYSPADIDRLRLMAHYTRQQIPRARAAALVRQAVSAPVHANPGVPEADARSARAILHRSLERFDGSAAERVLQRLVALFTPGVVLRDVVLPYLRELDAGRARDDARVAREHFASCWIESWMSTMTRGWVAPATRRAILACVPGEQHVLGLLAFGIALRDLGWSIAFLGRDTPLRAVEAVAAAVPADVIVLATVLPDRLADAAGEVSALARRHVVAVGGPGTERDPPPLPGSRLLAPDILAAAISLSRDVEPRAA
jgi:DNA-binding transcriptional MerR regulator